MLHQQHYVHIIIITIIIIIGSTDLGGLWPHYVQNCTEYNEHLTDGLLTAAKFIQKDEWADGWRNGRGIHIRPPLLLRK